MFSRQWQMFLSLTTDYGESTVDFDDLYQSSRKRELSQSKRLRFCCIFLIVAALTGIILWKIVPRSVQDQKSSDSQPAQTEQKPTVSEKDPDAKEKIKQNTAPADKPRSGSKSAPEFSLAPEQSPDKKSSGKLAGQGSSTLKGVAGNSDLPEHRDRPAIPSEPRLTADLSRRIAEFETQFNKKNFAAVTGEGEVLLAALTLGSEPYRKVLKFLSEANWQRFLNKDTAEGFSVVYTVAPGDSLGLIARKNQTTVAAVAKANKLKQTGLIRIGQKLALLPGKWRITVSKSKRLLLLRRNDKIFAGFDVGIGRFGKTPSADFVIAERLKHPVYRTGDGRVFKYGENGNQLGDYFLKLAAVGNPKRPLLGYGIHGTPDETTVTRSLSNGCIRMRNIDVEKLYYLLPAGVPVEIRD